jgi:hypothetical protein
VKYAAKRTWPDKPKSWETKGEAESAEAFALGFAEDQGLGLGTELVVIERDSDDAEIQFFKVSNTSPYQMAQAEPRVGGSAPPPAENQVETSEASGNEDATPGVEIAPMDTLRPFRSMIFYMGKVALVAIAVIYGLGMLFRYIREAL